MKKIRIVLICLVLFLASCNQPQSSDVSQTSSVSFTIKENFTTEEKSAETYSPEPPTSLRFGSFDEVRNFITAVEASEQDFEKYNEEYGKQTIFWRISYEEAKDAASALASVPFPIVSQDLELSMAMDYSYYQDHDWFEVTYMVEGIQCRFSYDLNCSSEKELSNQEYREAYMAANVPDFPNVPFGEYTIDLYTGEPYTVGWCQTDSVWVFVKFRTTQVELLKLEELQFSKLFQ